ncbi:MAG: asparaginase [Candidatus Cloacimonetes bacterium]|nr:asparaginase [Candidatus Cloacimonadota bacterium]
MSEIFIHKTRADVVECIHRGDALVVNPQGNVVAVCGDKEKYTYFRSSAKPMQALNVVLSGAVDKYKISPKELALICSSHYSEDIHIEAVRSILAKLRLDESALQCGVARSINVEVAFAQAEAGITAQRIKSDCSGKHSGMLATCLMKGYPLESYLEPQHPVQREILAILSDVCAYPADKIAIGTDGCNVPVFAMPIYNMALGFARFANSEFLAEEYQNPAKRIFEAMSKYPEMVAGTGGFCTELMQATKGRMIGKIGAQGVYCIGIREPQLGIALKIEDGAAGMAACAAMQVLRELKLLTEEEYGKLERFHIQPNLNDDKQPIGKIYPVFSVR